MGLFDSEIVPVNTKVIDQEGEKSVIVKVDDGIRADTTFEKLSKLKPAFGENGFTTAGFYSLLIIIRKCIAGNINK